MGGLPVAEARLKDVGLTLVWVHNKIPGQAGRYKPHLVSVWFVPRGSGAVATPTAFPMGREASLQSQHTGEQQGPPVYTHRAQREWKPAMKAFLSQCLALQGCRHFSCGWMRHTELGHSSHVKNGSATPVLHTYHYVHFHTCAQK